LSARVATRFFTRSTARLLAAGEAAGVKHHVALSIVGIDGVEGGYYAGKLAHERAVEQSERVPYTIVRAAQFHEFPAQFLARMPGPIAYLPTGLLRPVAAREVGEYLVQVARGEPAGRAADLVGPRDEVLADIARRYLRRAGEKQRVLALRMPGRVGKAFAYGTLRGTDAALRARRETRLSLTWPADICGGRGRSSACWSCGCPGGSVRRSPPEPCGARTRHSGPGSILLPGSRVPIALRFRRRPRWCRSIR